MSLLYPAVEGREGGESGVELRTSASTIARCIEICSSESVLQVSLQWNLEAWELALVSWAGGG